MTTPKVESAFSGLPVTQSLPTGIVESGKMSNTSAAEECFINQRFSSKLQAFMISYTNTISSNYAVLAV